MIIIQSLRFVKKRANAQMVRFVSQDYQNIATFYLNYVHQKNLIKIENTNTLIYLMIVSIL